VDRVAVRFIDVSDAARSALATLIDRAQALDDDDRSIVIAPATIE
jgi:hypothetical protein